MMHSDHAKNPNLSLYYMEDNPVEAILLKDSGSEYVLINRTFRKMFSIPDVANFEEVLRYLTENEKDKALLAERIRSLDNSLSDKPVRILLRGNLFHFYVYYHSDYELVIVHARNMAEFEKLTNQLDDYARGLVQNIFDLEVSQRKLIQSKNRLNRQLKASTELGLTSYEAYKNTRTIFRKFTETAAATLDIDRCGIWLVEDNWERIRCTDMFSLSRSEHISDINFLCRSYPELFKTIRHERLIKGDDAYNNQSIKELKETYLEPNGIKSVLISTIVLKGKIAGVVSFEHLGNIRNWEDDECGFAVIFSDHVARILSDVEKNILESQLIQSQKMESIGTLVGGLAHDFNNLLGGITGSLSLIKYRYEAIAPEELLKYVTVMENASNRAADLVRQLLTVASKQDLAMTPVNLNNSITHIVKICRNTFDKSVDIVYNCPDRPSVTSADPIQIEQVLLNLCINGYHAMTMMREENDKKGGTLTLEIKRLHPDDIFMQMHPEARNEDYWIISLEDTGIGMTKNTLQRIFEPFFTTKKNTPVKGSGLGLTMVYNIIRDHGGFIDVQSEAGSGSVFNVYLPVYHQENIAPVEETEKKLYTGEGLVLVIDDEEIMRITMKKMLQSAGYEVVLAENGEEGVAAYLENRGHISLVVLDMAMPKKSGRDVFYELKEHDPEVKVLLATGYMHDERSEEILKSGVKGFIQKPFSIYELSEAVYRSING